VGGRDFGKWKIRGERRVLMQLGRKMRAQEKKKEKQHSTYGEVGGGGVIWGTAGWEEEKEERSCVGTAESLKNCPWVSKKKYSESQEE